MYYYYTCLSARFLVYAGSLQLVQMGSQKGPVAVVCALVIGMHGHWSLDIPRSGFHLL